MHAHLDRRAAINPASANSWHRTRRGGAHLQELCARRQQLAVVAGAPPPAFVLEGGYDLGALAGSVAATIAGAGGEPPAWEYAGGVRPVEESRRALAPFWETLR